MSEMIWTTLTVKYPRAWHRETPDGEPFPIELLERVAGYLLESDDDITVKPDHILVRFEGKANYGLFAHDVADTMSALITERIPFIGTSDPKYEFDGEWVMYDGHDTTDDGSEFSLRSAIINGEGCPILDRSTYTAIINGKHGWAKTPEDYFNLPSLDDVDISHLTNRPPPERIPDA